MQTEPALNADPTASLATALTPYALTALAFLLLLAVIGSYVRTRKTRAHNKHARNQQRTWQDLKTLRKIIEEGHPGQLFAWLRKMDPYRFEELILSELQRRKLNIVRNEKYSGDGGIDGQFDLNGVRWFVQAKRYKAHIKEAHVRDFDALCQKHRAKGLFVHTGRTPEALKALERQCGVVRILSGEDLHDLFSGKRLKLSLEAAKPQPEETADWYDRPLTYGREGRA